VRRQDLFDSASERHSSVDEGDDSEVAQLREKLNARLSNLLAVNFEAGPGGDGGVDVVMQEDGDDQPPDEVEFEFRLFSTSAPSQKIALVDGDGRHEGPAISQRPLSFYVRGELSPEEIEQFRVAAVEASDIVAEARKRAWGLEVPWRVARIVVSMGRKRGDRAGGLSAGVTRPKGTDEEPARRKRPGKKRRIALRIKEKAKKEEEIQKMTKEEHLREKKKRLNREKKLKRRQKEKEKKVASKGGAEGNDGDESPSEADSE